MKRQLNITNDLQISMLTVEVIKTYPQQVKLETNWGKNERSFKCYTYIIFFFFIDICGKQFSIEQYNTILQK